jgi:hypothetical protein
VLSDNDDDDVTKQISMVQCNTGIVAAADDAVVDDDDDDD